MQGLNMKDKELNIKLNTEELNPTQVRLVKTMTALLSHLLTAEDESEYFNASAEFLRKAAEVIKHAQFAEQNTHMNYGEQAVEFAVDFLNESLDKGHNIDN